MSDGPGGLWPFMARDDELAVIDAFDRGVVLVGEAGIGKSRLLVEAIARAGPSARRVVRIAGTTSLAAVPFGAFAGALSREPEPGPSIEALSRVLGALADDGPMDEVVLAVDDAHLLDDASADVLLVAARSGARVFATVRSGETCPDAVLRLWKDDFARRLDVGPLDEERVGDLLEAALGAPLDERSRHRLHATTRGNLLFLRELIRHAQETNALVHRGGLCTWIEPATIAPGVLDLVGDRLQAVPTSTRDVIDVLAIGEPLGRAIVEAACGSAARADAEQSGIVVPVRSGRREELRLVHPLYATVIRSELGPARRQLVAGWIADALKAVGGRRRDDHLRVVLMSLEAARHCDPRELDAAALDAGSRGDVLLAERLARAAVLAGGGLESEIVLGGVLYWAGRYTEVVDLLGDDPPPDTPLPVVVNAARVMSQAQFFGLGDFDAADALLQRTIERVGPELAVEPLGKRSELLMFAGRARESIEIGRAVLADSRASTDARLRAYSGYLVSQANCGQLNEVETELPKAMALLAHGGPDLAVYETGGVVVATFAVHLFSGRLHETDALIDTLYTEALHRPADPYLGVWSFMRGRSALAQGRLGDATTRLRDAASLLRDRDPGEVLPWALAALAQALGAADDGTQARGAVEELLSVRTPAMHHIDFDIDLGQAWAASAQGERTRAREIAEDLGRSLLADGQAALAGLVLHDALRLGCPPDTLLDALEQVAATCDGTVFDVFVRHARARVADDIDGLLDAADGFERAGWLLHAAECAAGASAAAAAMGLRIRQRDAAVRSASLASRCGPALTPMLEPVTTKQSLGLLTRREQEVALLAARGQSKREIADTLSLSVRTVGNHINHLYAKLGIGSRAELAIALGVTPDDG